ncbi:hypothetical protein [Xanthomonas graminis]|uniref:hypothetical protein n=1 Tax=Xanthomonas graminis TaxID=3390026 RepID=UPI001640CB3C|nr:hypothetical protein [Xanthomonas translucens]UKE64853.1 hypothetical protein KM547_14060 [Xanthomonas translucens pv. phlei]
MDESDDPLGADFALCDHVDVYGVIGMDGLRRDLPDAMSQRRDRAQLRMAQSVRQDAMSDRVSKSDDSSLFVSAIWPRLGAAN